MRFKYRISVLDENTLEEAWHVRLSRLSIFLYVCVFIIVTFLILAVLIYITPCAITCRATATRATARRSSPSPCVPTRCKRRWIGKWPT